MRTLHALGASARSLGLIMAAGLLGGGLALAVPLTGSATAAVPNAATKPAWNSYYFGVEQNIPFCFDVSVTGSGSMLPLTSMTAGSTPAGMTNYGLQNVNLTTGSAQVCGTDTNPASTTDVTIAPVATNSGGSATLSATTDDYGTCTWTASGGASTSVFDVNQDLDVTGSQASFGAPITGGATAGSTSLYTTCSDLYVPSLGAFTTNMANPLPTPTDTNPSAAQGDLASSNLELNSGCYGSVKVGGSNSGSFGSGTAKTIPSPWVNGGTCNYGIGSNSAGGNTDSFATCPPTQFDVNIGYVSCGDIASSGTETSSFNYSSDDIFFNGQPVPQASTATLSTTTATPGSTVSVTGGTNWWGDSGGAPNSGPYGDTQSGAMYQVSAPGVYIGTTRGSAVPVASSTVTISADSYVCTGAESTSVGPNPCTMTPGQPSGSFQIPSGLAPGSYNVYLDESNTTPLPGNGPNDAYQTARGTNLGTAESSTPIVVKETSTDTNAASQSTITQGSSNTDTATITGSAAADPTGTVTFYECGPGTGPCSSGWTQFDTESLGGTANPASVNSASFKPNSPGEYCFTSSYSGDSNYLSSSDPNSDACYVVNAPPGSTSVTDAPTKASMTLGGTDTDTATVTGAASADPTGSVKFYECGPDTSPAPCTSGSWTQFDSENLSGTSNPVSVTSASFQPSSAGYWCFTAAYPGDSHYTGNTDTTADGCFDVTTPLGTTSDANSPAGGSITLGGTDTDTATVTGTGATTPPTGTVDFYECGPGSSPAPCTSGSWTQFDTESLGNSDPPAATSAAFEPTATGTWCFASVYLGDSHYEGSSDTTTDGCFVVKPNVPAPSITSFSPASAKVGATITIKGTKLAGATKVMIGTKAATIVTDKAGQIKIKVPKGAKTGKIKVTTPGGTAISKTNLKVT
jgi:trimeric autotransporter adhesin